MPPTRVPRCGALVVVVAVLAHPVPRLRRACRAVARARVEGAAAVCSRRACGAVAVCSRRERGATAPATSVPPCPRRASGAPAVVAAHEPSVPRLRRWRVPASAPASGVRVVDVPAHLERRSRRRSRALAPRAVCSSSERRAPAERAALVVRVPCARGEGAAAPSSRVPRLRRRGVLVSRVPPRPSPACGAVALASSVPSCSRSECRGRVPPPREPSRTSRGSGRPRPRPECRRALDEGAVRWCRGRRVRMVDVPSPSVPH